MKKISIILFFIGLALVTAGAVWIGADSIIKAVLSIGLKGLIILTFWQIFVIFILGWAWHSICPELGFWRLMWARTIREAAATCLPFSQVGGIVIGIRAICFKGYRRYKKQIQPSVSQGISSNIVDITTEMFGQIFFIILGISILLGGNYSNSLKWPFFLGVIFLIVVVVPLIWTQRQGSKFFRRIADFLSTNIARQWETQMVAGAQSLQQSLDDIWSHPHRVIISTLIHFIAWIGGAIGTWLCYRFLGAHINFIEAITIEAIACGAMSITFLVPANLGVQETAYVILGSIFGIDPNLSFGLSLLRRARDIIIGIPALLLWQIIEIRFLRRYSKEQTTLPSDPELFS